MKFVGVDLGWRSGETGLACLTWQDQRLQLQAVTRHQEIDDILGWIDQVLPAPDLGLVAVDAPTLIPNETGTRLSDRLTHQYFGKYHAGCYPANLSRPFAERTVGFGESLEDRGFMHAPSITVQQPGRYQIEVFPHPAMVNLFQLSVILKYKKGNLATRKAELKRLQDYFQRVLPTLTPALDLEDCPLLQLPSPITGKELKALEDQLDAIFCAYIGAYWWYWGSERNLVLGDRQTGYIIVPQAV